ncbi:protease complex subunit PrcB family protein [bacterium]|nr:protease complex subunit PrcB family protein [bacterium]
MKIRILLWVLIVILLGVAVWLFLKPSGEKGNKNSVAFTVATVPNPNAEFPIKKVITNDAEYQEFFGVASSGIDFTMDNLAVICLGKANTGGYSVEITSITKYENQIFIHVKDISPGKNCILIQVINYPFSAVTFEKSELPIDWKIDSIMEDCP